MQGTVAGTGETAIREPEKNFVLHGISVSLEQYIKIVAKLILHTIYWVLVKIFHTY